MTTDPVCGMQVDPRSAAGESERDGQAFYFCSRSCKQKFDADPQRFAAHDPGAPPSTHVADDAIARADPAAYTHAQPCSPPAVPAASTALYTCPMHPEVRREGPGACPECGMALEPLSPAPPLAKTEYTCPMHPEIVRDEPGNCPICGMALEPRTVAAAGEDNPELRDIVGPAGTQRPRWPPSRSFR